MKYNCKHCSFHWEGNTDTFDIVINHEKTHKKFLVDNASKEITVEVEK